MLFRMKNLSSTITIILLLFFLVACGSESNLGSDSSSNDQTETGTGEADTDNGGSNSDTGGSDNDTGGSDADTGGSDADTGGSDADTGGSDADTGGSDADAGGSDADAGGSDTDTGGSDTDTGGSDTDTGETDADNGDTNTGSDSNQTKAASVISPEPVIISWPLTKAYPGIEYNIRLGVIGGSFPYQYTLDLGPAGMQVSDNGTVTWTPGVDLEGQSYDVSLQVEDTLHQTVTQNFNLTVTQSGFVFVSEEGNDDTGTGSFDQPWVTINKALASGGGDDFLYVRGGSYTGAWRFQPNGLNKLAAYPGETVVVDYNLENGTDIYGSQTYIDGFEIHNIRNKAFKVDGGKSDSGSLQSQIVLRRNHMHHLYDNSNNENPSFLYFGDHDPDDRINKYNYNIIQNNSFHDLFDRGSGINGDDVPGYYHGGSNVWYNVGNSLYEDNIVHDIDGYGLNDKDDGYKNTYRGNHFYDIHFYPNAQESAPGLLLANQMSHDGGEVLYNIFENKLTMGWQPGYIANVEIHHNTFYRAGITFRGFLAEEKSDNFITYNNLFAEAEFVDDGKNPYTYTAETEKVFDKASFDYNLIGTGSDYICFKYYGTYITFADWRTTYEKGVHSILADPKLINPANGNFQPASDSPACGAGSDGGDIGAMPCASFDNTSDLQIPQGAKRVASPTFTFQDDFENGENDYFWGGSSRGSAYSYFGEGDVTEPSNHVLKFNYTPQGEHSWSQRDFHLPQVTEAAFLYRLYTPANYGNPVESNNQKLLLVWSGEYGLNNEGLTFDSEMFNDSQNSGKIPTIAAGITDEGSTGGNRGHIHRSEGNEELAVAFQDGQWHDMYIYVKAAPSPDEYGSMEVWRDGVKLISTDDDLDIVTGGWWVEAHQPPSEVIGYVNGFNYIDQGYFMGWWNRANLTEPVVFQMDDLNVMAK